MYQAQLASFWILNPEEIYLNHGGFGACPEAILDARCKIQKDFERNPLRFVFEYFQNLHDLSRKKLANYIGANSDRLVFTCNATEGVNIVLKSLDLREGDRLITTNHAYPGCKAALERVAERSGAEVVTVDIPYPLDSPEEITRRVLDAARIGARLVLIDHVSSETSTIFPVREIAGGLAELGVDLLVDGAHAPGMLPLSVEDIGAAWYTGNCHKWMCGPKTAGFLACAPGRLEEVEPLVTSFGRMFEDASMHPRQWEFFWRGTYDASSFFVLPELIDFMEGLLPGGWPEIMRRNHELAVAGGRLICDTLGIEMPLPESMIGSMVTIPLPHHGKGEPLGLFREDRLGHALYEKHRIEVPLMQWPRKGELKIRISAQLYNSIDQYDLLSKALLSELPAGSG